MNKSTSPTRNNNRGEIQASSNYPNASALSAALKGATLAFNKQRAANAADNKQTPSRPIPHRNSVSSASGALLAATQAARDYSASQSPRPRSPDSVNRHGTGGSVSVQDSEEVDGHNNNINSAASFLSPPSVGRPSSDNGKHTSASFIAATLAASRSPSPIPPTNASTSRGSAAGTRRHSVGAASILSASSSLGLCTTDAPDTESIKPTTSLVSLFEGKHGEDMDPVKRELAVRTKSRPELPRKESFAPELGQTEGHNQGQQRQKAKPKSKPKPKPQIALEDGADITSGPRKLDGGPRTAGEKARSETDIGGEAATRSNAPGGPPVRPKSRNRSPPNKIASATLSPKRSLHPDPQRPRSSTPPPLATTSAASEVVSPRPIKLVETPKLEPPIAPPPRRSTAKDAKTPTVDIREAETEKDDPKQYRIRRESQSSVSSDDTFVSASSNHSPRAVTPVIPVAPKPEPPAPRGSQLRRRNSLQSMTAPQPPSPRRPSAPRVYTPNMALDSLTNAIVASNLAASRVTASSSPNPPLPPPTRRHGNHHRPRSPLQPQRTAESLGIHYSGKGSNRSPQRKNHRTGMLQTLRAPPTSLSDDEDVRRRADRHNKKGKLRHLPGKHHAHHEGSRRRWRDEVSARERRRYEAVWASNKGLFLQSGWSFAGGDGGYDQQQQLEAGRAREGPEADLVVNVVVRDIWGRSRLPADELAEVWELVDRHGKGALGREEFVVGMWLIDQRLRGRKIPARVGASVWDSVRGGVAGTVVVQDPKAVRRDKGARGRK